MKWEEEKAHKQYNAERETLMNIVDKILNLNKMLYDINAGRNQYHKG